MLDFSPMFQRLLAPLTCPIDLSIMRNPVTTECGSLYEGAAICEYFASQKGVPGPLRDPLTKRELKSWNVYPSQTAANMLSSIWQEYLQMRNPPATATTVEGREGAGLAETEPKEAEPDEGLLDAGLEGDDTLDRDREGAPRKLARR